MSYNNQDADGLLLLWVITHRLYYYSRKVAESRWHLLSATYPIHYLPYAIYPIEAGYQTPESCSLRLQRLS